MNNLPFSLLSSLPLQFSSDFPNDSFDYAGPRPVDPQLPADSTFVPYVPMILPAPPKVAYRTYRPVPKLPQYAPIAFPGQPLAPYVPPAPLPFDPTEVFNNAPNYVKPSPSEFVNKWFVKYNAPSWAAKYAVGAPKPPTKLDHTTFESYAASYHTSSSATPGTPPPS